MHQKVKEFLKEFKAVKEKDSNTYVCGIQLAGVYSEEQLELPIDSFRDLVKIRHANALNVLYEVLDKQYKILE